MIFNFIFIFALALSTCLNNYSNAMDDALRGVVVKYSNPQSYLDSMEKEGKQSVLIVGCGKANSGCLEGDHAHIDCYTVDVGSGIKFAPLPEEQPVIPVGKKYWRDIAQSDDELDITQQLMRDEMLGQFDVVILERIWSKPLNSAWTLLNVYNLLKPGGRVIIESHYTYHFKQYDTDIHYTIINSISPSTRQPIIECENSKPILPTNGQIMNIEDILKERRDIKQSEVSAILKFLKVDDGCTLFNATELNGMATYLGIFGGFKNILALVNIKNPYNSRKSNMIIAEKVSIGEKVLQNWTDKTQRFARNLSSPKNTFNIKYIEYKYNYILSERLYKSCLLCLEYDDWSIDQEELDQKLDKEKSLLPSVDQIKEARTKYREHDFYTYNHSFLGKEISEESRQVRRKWASHYLDKVSSMNLKRERFLMFSERTAKDMGIFLRLGGLKYRDLESLKREAQDLYNLYEYLYDLSPCSEEKRPGIIDHIEKKLNAVLEITDRLGYTTEAILDSLSNKKLVNKGIEKEGVSTFMKIYESVLTGVAVSHL